MYKGIKISPNINSLMNLSAPYSNERNLPYYSGVFMKLKYEFRDFGLFKSIPYSVKGLSWAHEFFWENNKKYWS